MSFRKRSLEPKQGQCEVKVLEGSEINSRNEGKGCCKQRQGSKTQQGQRKDSIFRMTESEQTRRRTDLCLKAQTQALFATDGLKHGRPGPPSHTPSHPVRGVHVASYAVGTRRTTQQAKHKCGYPCAPTKPSHFVLCSLFDRRHPCPPEGRGDAGRRTHHSIATARRAPQSPAAWAIPIPLEARPRSG